MEQDFEYLLTPFWFMNVFYDLFKEPIGLHNQLRLIY